MVQGERRQGQGPRRHLQLRPRVVRRRRHARAGGRPGEEERLGVDRAVHPPGHRHHGWQGLQELRRLPEAHQGRHDGHLVPGSVVHRSAERQAQPVDGLRRHLRGCRQEHRRQVPHRSQGDHQQVVFAAPGGCRSCRPAPASSPEGRPCFTSPDDGVASWPPLGHRRWRGLLGLIAADAGRGGMRPITSGTSCVADDTTGCLQGKVIDDEPQPGPRRQDHGDRTVRRHRERQDRAKDGSFFFAVTEAGAYKVDLDHGVASQGRHPEDRDPHGHRRAQQHHPGRLPPQRARRRARCRTHGPVAVLDTSSSGSSSRRACCSACCSPSPRSGSR